MCAYADIAGQVGVLGSYSNLVQSAFFYGERRAIAPYEEEEALYFSI